MKVMKCVGDEIRNSMGEVFGKNKEEWEQQWRVLFVSREWTIESDVIQMSDN